MVRVLAFIQNKRRKAKEDESVCQKTKRCFMMLSRKHMKNMDMTFVYFEADDSDSS
jgi:hypothetical protein